MSGYDELDEPTEELLNLVDEYTSKFGTLPPLFIMDSPVEQIQHAMLVGKPYNPMPGDPGIPSDAIF